MNVLLVANMVASKQAFEMLKKELEKRGHQVFPFLSAGKLEETLVTDIAPIIANSNLIVLGMSSDENLAQQELGIAKIAKENNTPYCFYGDTYSSCARPHLQQALEKAGTLFVINGEEAEKASMVFPQLKVVVSGNPTWEEFCFPKFTPKLIRHSLSIAEDEIVILVPFGKMFDINRLHLNGVIQAVDLAGGQTPNGKKIRIIASSHPGDPVEPEKYCGLVEPHQFTRIIPSALAPTLGLLPGVDLVIGSASTVGVAAAHQGISVIDFLTKKALDRLEQSTGQRTWAPCNLGASCMVTESESERELMKAILALLKDPTSMRERQKAVYPAPTKIGAAVEIMADTIKQLAQEIT
ncbi:hypothetical protein KKF32_00265 [Patescibacteria group bacterium]|nr:hypothetical protein [Patescibacteria group bacterium]